MAEVKQAAIVAAQWWAKKIGNPNPDSFNNGDRTSQSSFFIMMMGYQLATQKSASKEQLDKFCKILSQRISEELDHSNDIYIECDYGPCALLSEASKLAGIDTCLFPFKRSMWIRSDSVTVKDGYDASIDVLYTK